ncbi:hypothetical protein GCM10028807_48180 [Spirosoma daeguense]
MAKAWKDALLLSFSTDHQEIKPYKNKHNKSAKLTISKMTNCSIGKYAEVVLEEN